MAFGLHSVKGYRRTFYIVLAALFVFRAWYMTTLPLSGDESYHWEWSRHPAFGYYDHPGLTAYLIRLFTILFGGSTEFSVRMPALVMLTATAVTAYYFARFVARSRGGTDIGAEHAGFLAGLIILLVPIYGFFSIYISTDPPLLFFWMLAMYLMCRALQSGKWVTWILAGAAFGCAMLSKFLAFFLLPAFLLFMLVSPRDRKWFVKPQPYAAGLTALLVFSPFIWWNATHGWATFMFNFVWRQEKAGFAGFKTMLIRVFGEYIGVQALCLGIGVFLFACYYIWQAFADWRERRDRFALYLGLCTLMPLLYFLWESTKQTVSPHWPVAGWYGVIIYMACSWVLKASSQRFVIERKLGNIALALAAVILFSAHILIYTVANVPPDWLSDAKWKYSDRISINECVELYGWEDLGKWVESVRDEMVARQGSDRRGVFVMCNQYGLASNVAFYSPSQIETHLWRGRRNCGENYRFWDDYPSFKGMDAVYVSKKKSRIEKVLPMLRRHFGTVSEIEELPVKADGFHVRSFYCIRCFSFNGVTPIFE